MTKGIPDKIPEFLQNPPAKPMPEPSESPRFRTGMPLKEFVKEVSEMANGVDRLGDNHLHLADCHNRLSADVLRLERIIDDLQRAMRNWRMLCWCGFFIIVVLILHFIFFK